MNFESRNAEKWLEFISISIDAEFGFSFFPQNLIAFDFNDLKF